MLIIKISDSLKNNPFLHYISLKLLLSLWSALQFGFKSKLFQIVTSNCKAVIRSSKVTLFRPGWGNSITVYVHLAIFSFYSPRDIERPSFDQACVYIDLPKNEHIFVRSSSKVVHLLLERVL